jgi:DNA-binding NarL/FixJ family response regulator
MAPRRSHPGARAGGAVKLSAPRELAAYTLDGHDDLVILEWPEPRAETPAGLTSAEQGVLALLREGLSNAEIAARRGRSVRTIANQVASIFAKCGVRSRSELFARTASQARG